METLRFYFLTLFELLGNRSAVRVKTKQNDSYTRQQAAFNHVDWKTRNDVQETRKISLRQGDFHNM